MATKSEPKLSLLNDKLKHKVGIAPAFKKSQYRHSNKIPSLRVKMWAMASPQEKWDKFYDVKEYYTSKISSQEFLYATPAS